MSSCTVGVNSSSFKIQNHLNQKVLLNHNVQLQDNQQTAGSNKLNQQQNSINSRSTSVNNLNQHLKYSTPNSNQIKYQQQINEPSTPTSNKLFHVIDRNSSTSLHVNNITNNNDLINPKLSVKVGLVL